MRIHTWEIPLAVEIVATALIKGSPEDAHAHSYRFPALLSNLIFDAAVRVKDLHCLA